MRGSLILFSNPAHAEKRINGTLRLSRDDGRTWYRSKTIYKGSFAYSCLADMAGDEYCILFERDDYQKISFTRLDINDIADEISEQRP